MKNYQKDIINDDGTEETIIISSNDDYALNMFKNYSDKEILAVFSHELGHAVYNHNQQLKLMNYYTYYFLYKFLFLQILKMK